MDTIGPGSRDFQALAGVAYRALRAIGLDTASARGEAESYAYAAAQLLALRVDDAAAQLPEVR